MAKYKLRAIMETFNDQEVRAAFRMTKEGKVTYPGVYLTEDGKVIGVTQNYLGKAKNPKTKYEFVRIINDKGKLQSVHVHELMCNVWVSPRPNSYYATGRPIYIVNHKDKDISNNHKDNLFWSDYSTMANSRYETPREIVRTTFDGKFIAVYKHAVDAAFNCGVSRSYIYNKLSQNGKYKEIIIKNVITIEYEHYSSDGQLIQIFARRKDAVKYAKDNKLRVLIQRNNDTPVYFFQDRFYYREIK